ncbi:MAG: hypothetical protein LUG16_08925 [Candidatus Gastranaerophilales bacterium]|nr:hypothetical protein [Candidatus Gastranaerophilales bacterium]
MAYEDIINQTYRTTSDNYDFVNETEAQYVYLIKEFKKAENRDIPLAVYYEL